MTTTQIVLLSILGVLALIGYFGNALSKKESAKFLFLFLLTFVTALFAVIAITQTQENNELKQQIKNKCPEYEKVENVYKLKQ